MSQDTYDLEPYAVYDTTIRKARKSHKCSACETTISPGERYADIRTVFDGSVDTYKRCGRCELTHRFLREKGSDHELYPMERLNCGIPYEEEFEEQPPPALAALPFLNGAQASDILVRCDRMENTLVDGQLPTIGDVLNRVVVRGEGAP